MLTGSWGISKLGVSVCGHAGDVVSVKLSVFSEWVFSVRGIEEEKLGFGL